MGSLSIISIITVSLPEAIIITLLGIITIGKTNCLLNKKNWIKILIFASILSVLSNITREKVGNELESLLVSLFAFSLLYLFILKFKFYESILASFFSLIIIAILQIPILMAITSITGNNTNEVLTSKMLFLYVLPERIIETLFIYFSIRFNFKIIDFESATIKRKEYYLQIFVYIVSVSTLIFLSYIMVKSLIVEHSYSGDTLLLRINIYLTIFITIILTFAIRSVHEFYKSKNALNNNEIMQNLQYISSLIEEKKYIDAINALDGLKTHITKQ